MGCGDLHLCDDQWVFVPKAEEQTISSAGMLVLCMGRITPQRMDTLMINGFLDMWKIFWHGIFYNSELLLKSHSTYRSIRRITDSLPFQWEFPRSNNLLYCRNKNFIYMEIEKKNADIVNNSYLWQQKKLHFTELAGGRVTHNIAGLIYFLVMLEVLSHEAFKFTEDHLWIFLRLHLH